MSNSIKALTVVLEKDYKDEGAEAIINAIKMTKGVLTVDPHVADIDSYVAEERVKIELGEKILKVLYPKRG